MVPCAAHILHAWMWVSRTGNLQMFGRNGWNSNTGVIKWDLFCFLGGSNLMIKYIVHSLGLGTFQDPCKMEVEDEDGCVSNIGFLSFRGNFLASIIMGAKGRC